MLVKQVREAARRWAAAEGATVPGYGGAFLTGFASWAPDNGVLEPGTDADLMVVVDGEQRPPEPGKLCYEGVSFELAYVPSMRLQCAVSVLCDAHLSGRVRSSNVLADPTGRLTALRERVSREFTNQRWVQVRCADAMDDARAWLAGIQPHDPLADQALAWVSGTAMTVHALLVAACRDPMVEHPYVAARDLLADHGRQDFHEVLLYLLGSAVLGRRQVEAHLDGLERAFDRVAGLEAPGFRYAADLSERARPSTVDGCRSLIARGSHREAVHWLVVSYARCLSKLSYAGVDPADQESDFSALLADLNASSYRDRRRHADRVIAGLPELWQVADSLTASAPLLPE